MDPPFYFGQFYFVDSSRYQATKQLQPCLANTGDVGLTSMEVLTFNCNPVVLAKSKIQ